jgi:hypothetical protein
MIQRIQTIYLLVSIVIVGIITALLNQISTPIEGKFSLISIGILAAIFILNLVTILLFKNRKLQLKLLIVSLLFQVGFAGLMAYLLLVLHNDLIIPLTTTIAMIIPTILARKAIQADEKLVRSMDRLR